MNPKQEMVATLLDRQTLDKVKQQFRKGSKIEPIYAYDLPIRLHQPVAGHINLEIMLRVPLGDPQFQDTPMGRRQIQKNLDCFRTIGFFTRKKGFLSDEITVSVPYEFEAEAQDMERGSPVKLNRLSLQENAMIGACSAEIYSQAYQIWQEIDRTGAFTQSPFSPREVIRTDLDAALEGNGLEMELLMSFNGYPQVFLDDKHGHGEPIVAYMQNSINPMTYIKDIYHYFYNRKMLTAFSY